MKYNDPGNSLGDDLATYNDRERERDGEPCPWPAIIWTAVTIGGVEHHLPIRTANIPTSPVGWRECGERSGWTPEQIEAFVAAEEWRAADLRAYQAAVHERARELCLELRLVTTWTDEILAQARAEVGATWPW